MITLQHFSSAYSVIAMMTSMILLSSLYFFAALYIIEPTLTWSNRNTSQLIFQNKIKFITKRISRLGWFLNYFYRMILFTCRDDPSLRQRIDYKIFEFHGFSHRTTVHNGSLRTFPVSCVLLRNDVEVEKCDFLIISLLNLWISNFIEW